MSEAVIAGRYRLDELLGRGGMSEVWSAEDLELGRKVALKLLAPDADRARFEREARAVAALAHPNVMQVYDYGESEGRPFMVLEYLPNGTLEDRLRAGKPLPDAETSAIAAGIATGLAHAHARGVVHRDLKPANVLFDEERRPKVADFGIARTAASDGSLTEAGTVLGTAAYISPEQASGEPATAASDVYSFGVILYRMLTGRLPFESNDPIALAMLHRDAQPPPIATLRRGAPAHVAATAAAALEKDPAARPADGAALLRRLGVATGATVETMPTPIADDVTRRMPIAAGAAEAYPEPPPRRSRAPFLAGALLVLALGGGALAYEVTRSSTSPTPTEGHFTSLSLPTATKQRATAPATPAPAPTTSQAAATQAATTQPATTERTTSQQTTAQTTAPPPTTTAPLPTTTAPPPTTTAPSVTTTALTVTLPGP